MSPSPCSCADTRPSAAELNAAIRVLARRDSWTPEDLRTYRRLVAEERAAVARERQAAA